MRMDLRLQQVAEWADVPFVSEGIALHLFCTRDSMTSHALWGLLVMRRLVLLLFLVGIGTPALAVKRVTVDQLQQILAGIHGKRDDEAARQLSNLELTERLSTDKLALWEADLAGPEGRLRLNNLARESVFLDPPREELPALPPPGLPEQRRIMALTVDYVSKTTHQLPNFYATRETTRFEDTPQGYGPNRSFVPYQPLHAVGSSSATTMYRDGEEIADSSAGKKPQEPTAGLNTSGEFGPILQTALLDGAQSKLTWSHWERGAHGPEAVFGFEVPKEKSHYQVTFCCVSGGVANRVFQRYSGYRGEIGVDPTTGAVLRLTLAADLKSDASMTRADIMVEYGQVEIGDKTYICPARSVSMSVVPADTFRSSAAGIGLGTLLQAGELRTSQLNDLDGSVVESAPGTSKKQMNEVVFSQYHLFHADTRMLAGTDAGTDAIPSTHRANSAPAPETNHTNIVKASPAPTTMSPMEAAPAEKPVPTTLAPVAEVPAPTPAVAIQPPEMTDSITTTLPDTPPSPSPVSDSGFVLREAARLVDVDVIAYDVNGHPVTDLKPEDFEIYDNGRKQKVQFSNQAANLTAQLSSPATEQLGNQATFSNSSATVAYTKPQNPGSVTVLLIDSSNLAWTDLTSARQQMLRFLRGLPAADRAAIYVLKTNGFQILEEATADHALLEAKLAQWMPSAQDLARAQEEERRNRQEIDYVRRRSDLQYVNGNNISAPETAMPADPQLRDNESSPGRDSLLILVGVARDLATVPGHKNAVWVTSDNVLADWTDKAAGSDKGSKHIEGFGLRVQEAMNEAHVALYPLDASHLEGSGIDANLQTRNVEVEPGAVNVPMPGKQPAWDNMPVSGDARGGRNTAQMQQDIHAIQGTMRELAEGTGGRAIQRSGDITSALNSVVQDGMATYLLSFSPNTVADDQYHVLTVKLTPRRGVILRYRTGYFYTKEPITLKERFQRAIWQPLDLNEIAVSAHPATSAGGVALKLNITTGDLALKQDHDRLVDKLDIFLVQRDREEAHARVTGQSLGLALLPATYRKLLGQGLPFEQVVHQLQDAGSVRIIVVDENSGRMGSITVPAASMRLKVQ
jgi:VWFA-related protein